MVWQSRLTQAAGKYSEHAPVAATCCNACRACAQTNAVALALGAIVAAGAGAVRLLGLGRHEPRP
jgi:hypothetical protein